MMVELSLNSGNTANLAITIRTAYFFLPIYEYSISHTPCSLLSSRLTNLGTWDTFHYAMPPVQSTGSYRKCNLITEVSFHAGGVLSQGGCIRGVLVTGVDKQEKGSMCTSSFSASILVHRPL